MRQTLPQLLDETTVTDRVVRRGRINVNQAPRAVLRGVPGLDASTIEQIVARRNAPGVSADPNRRHATWLLTEGLVDLEQMKVLMPYLTAGGDVFRGQIVGYFDGGGASARVELVMDATTAPPRQLYCRNLRLLGRGYPLEALGAAP